MKLATTLGLMAALGLCACGGDDAPGTTDDGNDTGWFFSADGLSLTFSTPEFEIAAGDSFHCFYTDAITDRELAVYGATGEQDVGGHHILAYYTDNLREPEYHECADNDRVSLHQIAGSAGQDVDGEVLGLHDNMAVRVPEGVQLVLEAHYINTSGAPMTVKDDVTLKLYDPEDVSDYVNYYVLNDDIFEVPPAANYSNTTYCEVERDLEIVLTLGHMHEDGERYQLDIIDAEGEVLRNLRTDAWTPSMTSHPPITTYPHAEPLLLEKGTLLRQQCQWHNSTPQPLIFPREMCVGFMYYKPENADITCNLVPTLSAE